jgi:hypothetical protein
VAQGCPERHKKGSPYFFRVALDLVCHFLAVQDCPGFPGRVCEVVPSLQRNGLPDAMICIGFLLADHDSVLTGWDVQPEKNFQASSAARMKPLQI